MVCHHRQRSVAHAGVGGLFVNLYPVLDAIGMNAEQAFLPRFAVHVEEGLFRFQFFSQNSCEKRVVDREKGFVPSGLQGRFGERGCHKVEETGCVGWIFVGSEQSFWHEPAFFQTAKQ